jgi:hypothetical protein
VSVSVFTPDMGRPEKYLVAHPNSLVILPTLDAARARADAFRETYPVKVYRLVEVETHFQRGKPPPLPPPRPPSGVLTKPKAA